MENMTNSRSVLVHEFTSSWEEFTSSEVYALGQAKVTQSLCFSLAFIKDTVALKLNYLHFPQQALLFMDC